MATVNVLRLRHLPIFKQLHIEEALFRATDENWFIVNDGTPEPAVVLGISGKPARLVHGAAAAASGVPLIRRFTGGGTVVVDEDTIFTAFIGGPDTVPGLKIFPKPLMHWSEDFFSHAFAPFGLARGGGGVAAAEGAAAGPPAASTDGTTPRDAAATSTSDFASPASPSASSSASASSSPCASPSPSASSSSSASSSPCASPSPSGSSSASSSPCASPSPSGSSSASASSSTSAPLPPPPGAFTLAENDYALGDRKFGGNAQAISSGRWVHHTSFLWSFRRERMALLRHPERKPAYRNERPHEAFLTRLQDHVPSRGAFVEALLACPARSGFRTRDVSLDDVMDILRQSRDIQGTRYFDKETYQHDTLP